MNVSIQPILLSRPMILPIVHQSRERSQPFGSRNVASPPIFAHSAGIYDFWIKKSRSHHCRDHANRTQSPTGQRLASARFRATENPKLKNPRALRYFESAAPKPHPKPSDYNRSPDPRPPTSPLYVSLVFTHPSTYDRKVYGRSCPRTSAGQLCLPNSALHVPNSTFPLPLSHRGYPWRLSPNLRRRPK